MNLESGEIIVIDNKEYICVSTTEYNGDLYIYLMSNFKPLEIKFARKLDTQDSINLEIINNSEQKEMLLELFSKSISE